MTVQLKTKAVDHMKVLDLMSDIDAQPDWRSKAKVAHAYYDGDQLPANVVAVLKERNQPETMHNLIAPTVDGVLGMEAKTRTDLMVIADDPDEEMELLAEAVNAEFSDACRLGRMDKARSDAYANQIKCGIGFVEVYRNPNPFGSRYKIKNVPRDEIYWDWFSVESDWSDCRWVMRQRWIDVDELISMVPNKAKVIEYAANNWQGFVDTTLVDGYDPDLLSAWEEHNSWTREQTEYLSQNRKRIKLQIIYIRKFERMSVLRFSNGRVIEYRKDFIPHQVALGLGKAQLENAQVSRIYESWFAGPHHLGSRECQAPNGMFPIVPFFGYRKDSNNEPYGLIARAIPAQNEVNFRRIKLTWLLQAKRVIADEDATNMSRTKILEEVEKADGYIELNPERRNKKTISEAFQVQQDFNIAAQQFNVMQESMKLIQDTMGIYSAFLGQESGADSGVAIANLVEQGATTLAEINDNYRFSCQLVGELLLGYILEDMKSHRDRAIVIHRDDKHKRKTVMINQETEEGLTNDITRLRAHITLAPIQQTSAYKAQLADRMMQLTAQLPPQVQVAVIDLVAELSDIPNKHEFMERVHKALNIPKDPDDMTPEEKQAQVAQQQQEQMQMELAMRELKAKVEKLEAEAMKIQAGAQKEQVTADSQRYDNAKTQAETAKILKEMERLTQEIYSVQGQFEQNLQDQIDSISL
ncbi:portal protein [Vibrio rhizosphaerae]|uniref:Portal protein n=1 Tax=Vibrio rhizosphaerae TaxID=398736 RepID=A0ABU4IXG7_9VIBR|nr:portal protein [Vibrio rhizosphaerae]MDW6094045.1 portal protein [Vibrio rhizosphaerae]